MFTDLFEHDNRPPRSRGAKVLRIAGMTIVGLIAAVLFALVFGLIVKWLWNWLMPAIFGLGVLTFWQAFGIVLLAKLLFGGFGHQNRHRTDHSSHENIAGFFHGEKRPPLFRHGNGKKWALFRHYWEDEGRRAFEDYIRRKEESEGQGQNDE